MAILSDEFYYQPIRIDTINTRIYADLLAKEGDANGRGLLVTLTENGLMKDTTGITLILKWEHTSVGNQGLDNFEAVDLSKGLYKITYPTEMLNRGKIRAFIQIIDSGKLAGTRNIEITVNRGVGDDTAIASSNSFTALAQALIDVTNLESTYAPRLLSTERQLAEMKPAFASSVNKFGAKQKPFLKFRQALLKKQVNVTYWTDSIGTGGSKLGINSATPSGTEQAPNGIVNSEGMSHFITKELAKANPDVVFNFYNRGIGGTRITEWNALKTFDAVEKTWVEHIKDTSPDLLFVSFGMNHSLYATTKTFASSLKALCDYINLNFTKVPDIVLVTSPTPVVVEGNTTWSDDINQESRRNTGKSARYFGLPYVDYVLDVSRFSDIARFGKDLENCYFEQKTDFKTVGSTSLKTKSSSLKIDGKYRDFTLKFLFTTANVTNREYLLIRFNRAVGDVDISNQLCIFPNYDGITKIESLGRFADATNLAYKTAIYNHPSMTTAQYIRVEKKGNILKVFIDDDPETLVIYDDKLDVNNVLGEIEFIKQGGSVSTINLLNLAFYEPKYVEYKKTISEAEMWGAFVNLDYTTRPITGGNGVNHPSSRGVAQVYGTPINEMISDIDKLSSNLSEVNLEMYKDYIDFVANAAALVGYCYVNFRVSDLILLEGFVYSADLGIKLKRNKKVTKPDNRALLLDDEYGIYITGGVPQIIFKNTMGATGLTTPFKFYTYKFM